MSLLATVIIVSQGRPQSLTLTLDALRYQTLPEFEVIVVGGTKEQAAIDAAGFSGELNFVAFHARNIAAARNVGISAARGDIVAFLDDDAVPAPGWIKELTTALVGSDADLAAGYVRGPDGVRFQFTGAFLLADATHEPIETVEESKIYEPSPGRALEAMGTNVAYTKAALEASGGFDPAFAYFLDESDLNWRLARAGAKAVVVPWAQVVHSLAASKQRSAGRVPLSLFDIGRSTRVFLDKHYGDDAGVSVDHHRARHEERLLRHVHRGRLKRDKVSEILASFDVGAVAELGFEPTPEQDGRSPVAGRLMNSRMTVTRVDCSASWFGKETLTYSGGGVWGWSKPRLRRARANDSISSVARLLKAQ